MFKKLLGAFKALLLVINILVIPIITFVCAVLRLIPIKPLQKMFSYLMFDILSPAYISINGMILKFGSHTKWTVVQKGELHKKGWYFLMSNHRSWADILVLQAAFNRKIPMLKFFMKKELLWSLPVLGITAYLMDFPVMHRHTKEYLKKHPGQRNKDIETTRKKCEIFKTQPVTIINFLEGTRFTKEKHELKNSPYQHLLQPKAGGIAFTLATMEGVLHDLIDVTIYYKPEGKSLWDLLCDEVDEVIVNVEVFPIPDEIRGDYYNDKNFRIQFQSWLNERWKKKDELIAGL